MSRTDRAAAEARAFDDLVAHRIGQRLARTIPVDLVAVEMKQRVQLRQAQLTVAMQHGEAGRAQRPTEESTRPVVGRRQRRMVRARR